jgi:hypothetical protein
MSAIDFHIAVGAHYEDSRPVQIARNMQQQFERCAVCVLQVFEHQQQRRPPRNCAQQVHGCIQKAPAILLRVSGRTRQDMNPLAHH